MQRLLIHPPFADPTQPYVSLPVLKGYLRSKGLDARVLDLNVEAVHHLFRLDVLDDMARRLGLRFLKLNHAGALDFEEQREYRALLDARPKIEAVIAADPPPLEVFRRRELFFDAAQYSLARRRVEATFDVLSALHFPYRFGFSQAAPDVLPWSVDLLERYWRERQSPLDGFYRRIFSVPEGEYAVETEWIDLQLGEVDFIGISVIFPSQLAEAYYLARLLGELAPRAFLALGGPTISQIALRVDAPILLRLLDSVDAVGLFEGEETLATLFPLLPNWSRETDPAARLELLRDVPNLLVGDPGGSGGASSQRVQRGPPHVVDLDEAPLPDYSDLDLDRYVAPSRTVLYAPTRGCYWNRCSFCHYGLSETGTSPYREVPPERAASHLAQLSRRHGVRNVYISCDVLSPSYALRFAEALIARGLKIRWSSDLKIETYYTPERCEVLYRSGLRSAAFGMESGSDRILKLIGKGCDRATLTEVSRAFHAAGVATQWMTFTDHPGETTEDAIETVQWIEEEKESVDLFIVGEFGLEHGSRIACSPASYGVEAVYYAEGDDMRLHALFTQRMEDRSARDRRRIEGRIRTAGAAYALHPYPWAGAVSTHHTFLHFLEFGQKAFRVHFQRAGAENEAPLESPGPLHISGLRERPRFSAEAIARREKEFFASYLPKALRPAAATEGGREACYRAPLSAAHYRAAVAAVEPLRAGKDG